MPMWRLSFKIQARKFRSYVALNARVPSDVVILGAKLNELIIWHCSYSGAPFLYDTNCVHF